MPQVTDLNVAPYYDDFGENDDIINLDYGDIYYDFAKIYHDLIINHEVKNGQKQKEIITKEFFQKNRKGFGSLLYDHERDCPVCGEEFNEEEMVI